MLCELRRIRNLTLLKALCGGIKDGLRPLSHEIAPGLELYASSQLRADLTSQIRLHQLDLSSLCWKRQHLTAALHGCKIEIGQHHFIGGATECCKRHLCTGSCTQHKRTARGSARAQAQRTLHQRSALL
jgi:hypothetical protein